MKKMIWLLIIINISLLAYFNLDRILPTTQKVKQVEIQPEKISILSQSQIDALPKKQAEPVSPEQVTPPKVSACYEWGVFSGSSITNAQSAAAKLALQATVKEQLSPLGKRFWIYRPPLRSTQEAQARAAELKALGVDDLFVVQEPKWKNAISFGIFEDEQLAIKLLNELKAKGIKDAAKTLRNLGKDHSSLVFKQLSDIDVAEVKKLKPEFPDAELKEVSCQ